MRHNREEVIERMMREFELLDQLVSGLDDEDWNQPVPRPESKDPWTVKDALAHITQWKADVARVARGERPPREWRGLNITESNHLVYLNWRDRSAQDVLAWHRQVQTEVLAALRSAPEAWFSKKERSAEWPNDLDSHSAYHRVMDIKKALER